MVIHMNFFHDFREGIAVNRETAARRRGSEADPGWGNGRTSCSLVALLRRGAARQQEETGTGDQNTFHFGLERSLTKDARRFVGNRGGL